MNGGLTREPHGRDTSSAGCLVPASGRYETCGTSVRICPRVFTTESTAMRRPAVLITAIALGCAALAIPSIATASVATCDDYANQAEAQRAKDTRDADGDGIYCETLPCPCLAPDPRAGSGGSVDPLAPPVPLSFDSLTPNDGETVAVGTIPSFTMFTSADYPYGVRIEVSRKPTLGQDGTLADDYTTDRITLLRSDANPNTWSGSANFELGEGVYYWQVSVDSSRFNPSTGQVEFINAVGPVRSITAKDPIRLGVNEGYRTVRYGLKRKFGARFTHRKKFRVHYSRLSATTIRYRVSWLHGDARYRGSVKVHEDADDYSFWVNVRRRR